MGSFISEIRKVPPVSLIYLLSEQSIEMFKQQKYLSSFSVRDSRYNMLHRNDFALSLWDIPNIDYLSVCNSNDHRNPSKAIGLSEIVALYRGYDNDHSIAAQIRKAEFSDVMRFLTGMTSEQFLYEDLRWAFQAFNRNYYILVSLQRKFDHILVDVEDIVKKTFGMSAVEYISLLMLAMWLCMQHPDPLSAPEQLYKREECECWTKENLEKIIKYYSCNYHDIRSNPIGKQLFYSKPFIQTESPRSFIACTVHLVIMTLGTGLYWVIRDYYKTKSQAFVNSFGKLFEEYIKDISGEFCLKNEFVVLQTEQDKSADFLFEFDRFRMIVEAKSSLMGLDAKQQVPELKTINAFIDRVINKAYKQLASSHEKIQSEKGDNKPAIKVILLYDIFSTTALIEQSSVELFENDPNCFVMTIRELEILLMIYHDQRTLFNQVSDSLLENTAPDTVKKHSIAGLFQTFDLWKYDFFKGERDCFGLLLERYKTKHQ